MKDPFKYAIKELAKHGCELLYEGNQSLVFRMPGGRNYTVTKKTSMPHLRSVIEDVAATSGQLASWTLEAEKPDLGDYQATPHFSSRFTLMQEQAGLTVTEVAACLTDPVKVLARENLPHRRLLVNGRVGVIVDQRLAGGWSLISVLWTRRDLFLKYPRPEEDFDA